MVGPLLAARGGYTHIFVLVDYVTRYPEAILWQKTGAKIIAWELLHVFFRIGFPSQVITENGTNSMCRILQEMLALLEV